MNSFAIRRLLLTGAAAALFTGTGAGRARAQTTSPGHSELVAQAMQAGQTQRVMEAVSQAMVDTLIAMPQLARLKPEQRTRLGAAMARAYAPRRFVDRVRELMTANAQDSDLRQFINNMRKPLSQKALEMEIVASAATTELIERHARSIATDPETIARINAVRRLDAASGGTEMLLAVTVATVLSSQEMQRRLQADQEPASTENEPVPVDPRTRRAQVPREEVERLARNLRPRVHREVINSSLFTYRWLSLDELLEYTEMHEQMAMRKIASLINDALGSVFMVAQADAVEQILLEVKGKGETPA